MILCEYLSDFCLIYKISNDLFFAIILSNYSNNDIKNKIDCYFN